jgi:hypothetical protein
LPVHLAQLYYQDFKFAVVGRFNKDGWILTPAEIKAFIDSVTHRKPYCPDKDLDLGDQVVEPIEPPVDIYDELEDGGEQALGM